MNTGITITKIYYICIMIQRELADKILKKGLPRKVLVLLGARQTGKTTLVKNALPRDARILSLTGDDPATINMLETAGLESLKLRLADSDVVFIDEAQRMKVLMNHSPAENAKCTCFQ